MKYDKIMKYIFYFFLVFFLFMYIAGSTGFYEYKLSEEQKLTEEQIKKFEEDVKNGVNIDIYNYIPKKKNYDNLFTKTNRDIAGYISSGFKAFFDYVFKYIERSM